MFVSTRDVDFEPWHVSLLTAIDHGRRGLLSSLAVLSVVSSSLGFARTTLLISLWVLGQAV